MTSGIYATVPLSFIHVNREARQRKELRGVEELAQSIRDRGLIHAPIVTRQGELIAGERRLEAVRLLGWDHIQVQWVDTVDPLELHALELEENVKRVDLTWQEQTEAIAAYDELRRKQDPNWNVEKTAEALGISKPSVYQHVAVGAAMKTDPKIREAQAFSVARNLVARKKERAASVANLQINETLAVKKTAPDLIIQADFHEWVKTYQGPKFNLVHCDFPYGVFMHKTGQGTHQETMGLYDDRPEVFFDLLDSFVKYQNNFLDESCHIMFWFHMKYYERTCKALAAAGFEVNPVPLIWHKTDNTGVLSDPNRRPRHIYETALLGARGDRKLVKPKSDVIGYQTVADTFHTAHKPGPVLQHFLEMLCDEHSVFLDPTAGSGSAIRVAKRLGARHILGLELNPEYVKEANERVNQP